MDGLGVFLLKEYAWLAFVLFTFMGGAYLIYQISIRLSSNAKWALVIAALLFYGFFIGGSGERSSHGDISAIRHGVR